MPIYEYQCASCGQKIEVIQKISDEPLQHCEACGKDSLKKLISATHFQLKGSGWYKAPTTEKSAGASTESASKSTGAESSAPSSSVETSSIEKPVSKSDKDK